MESRKKGDGNKSFWEDDDLLETFSELKNLVQPLTEQDEKQARTAYYNDAEKQNEVLKKEINKLKLELEKSKHENRVLKTELQRAVQVGTKVGKTLVALSKNPANLEQIKKNRIATRLLTFISKPENRSQSEEKPRAKRKIEATDISSVKTRKL